MTKNWCETDSKALDRKEYYQERRLKDLQLDLPWEVRWLLVRSFECDKDEALRSVPAKLEISRSFRSLRARVWRMFGGEPRET